MGTIATGGSRQITLGTLAALLLLLLAGCAGGGGSAAGTGADGPAGTDGAGGGDAAAAASRMPVRDELVAEAAPANAVAVVRTKPTERGTVIVDSKGMTLYISHTDNPLVYQFSRPPTPSCYGDCAEFWPPLLTELPPKAVGGAEQRLLGTIRRTDGSRQVTYADHPLYRFVNDLEPGETNGDNFLDFGSGWHALEPDGEELRGGQC